VLSLIAASLLLGLLLILVIVLIRFWLSIATIRTRYLRELPVERFESDELVLPEPLLRDISEFERLGFRMVTRTIDKFGSVVAHCFVPRMALSPSPWSSQERTARPWISLRYWRAGAVSW
jgi:hypothetical protein